MVKFLLAAALLLALPLGTQAEPKSPLAPVIPQIRAVVRHAQPNTEFGTGPGLLMAGYRAANHVYQPKSPSGARLPVQVQYGPRPGGFYLLLAVAKAQGKGTIQTTPPTPATPWTTVVSTYPLAHGDQMIVMTWEATPGAPHGLAARVRTVLLRYAAHAK